MSKLFLVLLFSLSIAAMEKPNTAKLKALEICSGLRFSYPSAIEEKRAQIISNRREISQEPKRQTDILPLTYYEYMELFSDNDLPQLVMRCAQEKDRLRQKLGPVIFSKIKNTWSYKNLIALKKQAQKQKKPIFFTANGVRAIVRADSIITYHDKDQIKLQKAEWLALVMPYHDELISFNFRY